MPQHDLPLLPRGVHRSVCLGPNGETILFAVDHNHRHLRRELGGVVYLLPGDNPFTANDRLWELLNRLDPLPQGSGQIIAALFLMLMAS